MNIKVINIPDGAGKDADECIKKDKKVWFEAVDRARDIMEWFFASATKNKNIKNPKIKQEIANELLPLIAMIPFAVEKDFWLKKLADTIEVEPNILKEDAVRLRKNIKSVNAGGENEKEEVEYKKNRLEMLLEKLLSIFLGETSLIAGSVNSLPNGCWVGSKYQTLYEIIKNHYNTTNDYSSRSWDVVFQQNDFGNEVENLKMALAAANGVGTLEEARGVVADLIEQIKLEYAKTRRQEILLKIKMAEEQKNEEEVKNLLLQLQQIK
jgi:DNA primase